MPNATKNKYFLQLWVFILAGNLLTLVTWCTTKYFVICVCIHLHVCLIKTYSESRAIFCYTFKHSSFRSWWCIYQIWKIFTMVEMNQKWKMMGAFNFVFYDMERKEGDKRNVYINVSKKKKIRLSNKLS